MRTPSSSRTIKAHSHTHWISQKSKKNGNEPFKRRKWHVACVYRIRERIDTWWISFSLSFSHFRTINSFVFCFSQLLIMRWSSPPITSNIDQSMFHKWEVSFLSFLGTYILCSSSTYLLYFFACWFFAGSSRVETNLGEDEEMCNCFMKGNVLVRGTMYFGGRVWLNDRLVLINLCTSNFF